MGDVVRYASGEKAWGWCQRCGLRALLKDLVFDGYYPEMRVHPDCQDDRHPQERLTPLKDAQALFRPSPEPGGPTSPTLSVSAGVDLVWTAASVKDQLLKGYLIYRTENDIDWELIASPLLVYSAFGGITVHPLGYTDAITLASGEARTYRVDAIDMMNRIAPSNLSTYTEP